jgi:hypothetical protein
MNRYYILDIIGWIITIGLLFKFIPKNKIREAHVAFFFKQVLTWVLGLAVVQYKLIEYPVRLFPYATKTSFSFEYFIYPSLCAIFNVNYPQSKKAFGQFMYYCFYCTTITIVELYIEKHTDILKYIHWTWYITWITLFITFYCTRKYYVWFFKIKTKTK